MAGELVVFDSDIGAVGDAGFVIMEEVEGSFGATLADGFEFSEGIGEGHEGCGALEGGEFEGGAKAVAEDGDVEGVSDLVELEDLFVGEELGFVDEDGAEFGGCGVDFGEVEPIVGEVVEVGGG